MDVEQPMECYFVQRATALSWRPIFCPSVMEWCRIGEYSRIMSDNVAPHSVAHWTVTSFNLRLCVGTIHFVRRFQKGLPVVCLRSISTRFAHWLILPTDVPLHFFSRTKRNVVCWLICRRIHCFEIKNSTESRDVVRNLTQGTYRALWHFVRFSALPVWSALVSRFIDFSHPTLNVFSKYLYRITWFYCSKAMLPY